MTMVEWENGNDDALPATTAEKEFLIFTKTEAERVGKYMIRPLLSLERLSLDEKHGHVCYRYGEGAEEVERMDYLEFIARVTSHIPDKGQVTVRYSGLC
ncbi:MAG: transposase [Candidatus Aminicenantales bacterium]